MDHENNNVPKPKLIVFDLGEYTLIKNFDFMQFINY